MLLRKSLLVIFNIIRAWDCADNIVELDDEKRNVCSMDVVFVILRFI